VSATRIFPTDDNPGVQSPQCHLASPQAWEREGETELIIASGNRVRGLSPLNGEELWSVEVPAPEGEVALLVSTPVIVDDILVAAYAVNPASDGVSTIPFRPGNALNRATRAHARAGDDVLGRVFVTFGNLRDIQPWHGEAFEVSLDEWRDNGADVAVTGQLITTPEADCGPAGASGSSERICGGGLWGPGGHLIIPRGDTFELIIPTGNGQLDVGRDDYANSVIRTGPGLDFDPDCDPVACADFNPESPALSCLESCSNAFIHRFAQDEEMPAWGFGVCDGLTMYECWGKLDYTGGSTPILVELSSGAEVIVSTGKDGGVYLIDPDHLGLMHDRIQITAPCGQEGDRCIWNWAGTIVTTSVHARVNGEDLVLIPTFMPDNTNDAGVVAVAVVETADGPRLEPRWNAPASGSDAARTRFRRHPSRLSLQQLSTTGAPLIGWVVEAAPPNQNAHLFGVSAADGTILADELMAGPGYRFTKPLVIGDRVFVPSCRSDDGPSFIEGYDVSWSVE
jgi:hypothetical protein